jgi:RNA recognition motif-containing protein
MNTRLYVGNLSYDVTKDMVRGCFAACGDVSDIDVVMDPESGRPGGVAFVTMRTEAQAIGAIAHLHDSMFEGRLLHVTVAEERDGR